ncbi:MAG: hypothetical protein IKY66_09200 [Bacteroidales bacterium]|nr:hypothetical protein [Bacteroidales bacterium]
MRKTFLTFCVAALSLLAVSSCYDDTALWGEVDALKAKVESLENKLNTEVAAINAALDVQLKFQVNAETFEVSVSYDNGATWVATGIYANDATVEVVYEDGSDELTLVVNGTAYSLSVYAEELSSSLVLGRTDFFLMFGGTKVVELTAEGIADYYVMAKPDGWKASFEGTTLTVVAPSKDAYKVGAAEEEGEILVHATTLEGKCKVVKLDVRTGDGLTVSVDMKGNLTFTNSYTSEQTNMATGEKSYGFENFYIGFASDIAGFEEDPVAYFDFFKDYYEFPNWDYSGMFYNNGDIEFKEYVEVEYETDVVTTTMLDIYSWLTWGEELSYGVETLLWVVPADEKGMPISEAGQYVKYTRFDIDVEITNVTHNDADLTMSVKGATNFYVGLAPVYPGVPMETVFSEANLWMYLQQPEYLDWWSGYSVTEAENETIKLSELNGEPLDFDTSYYVYVFPYMEGTEYTDFAAQFEPYVMTVTTNALQAGGSCSVEFGDAVEAFDSITVPVTISEDTDAVYYYWYSEEEFAEFENDADVLAALFEDCYMPMSAYETEVYEGYLNPGETWVLAAVPVSKDGKYGEVVADTFKTKEIPYVETISATLESLTLVDGTYTAVLSVTGATKIAGYNVSTPMNEDGTVDVESEAYNNAYISKYIATKPGVYYSCQWADVVDGKATVTFSQSSYKKDYYVWGYNVDEDGAVVELQTTPLSFNLAANLPAAE